MRDPTFRILRPLSVLGHLQLVVLHQMQQHCADHEIRRILANALAGAKAKPPEMVPQLRRRVLPEETLRPVRARVRRPELVPHVEAPGVDHVVGAPGDAISVHHPLGGRRLGDGERQRWPQSGRLQYTRRQIRARPREIRFLRRGPRQHRDLLVQLGLAGRVGGQEDEVPGEATRCDVQVGVQRLIQRLLHLCLREGARARGVVQLDDEGERVLLARTLVRRLVEGVPLRLELPQLSIGLGGEETGEGESGQATEEDVFHEVLARRCEGRELGLHLRREGPVVGFCHDEEGKHLEILHRVNQSDPEVSCRF